MEESFYQNAQCVIVKKSKFIDEREASTSLGRLEIKTNLSNILLISPLLF